ncbi:MAG: hypothetical protein ABSE49_14995 [Polyangiaceae bacterium]|jgi:hypothetical protein
MRVARLAAAGILAATLLVVGTARGQATYGSAPIGGRSALMGGTGIANGRDGAAPLLNPATVVHIDDSGVAFSMNFYSYQTTQLSSFHQPGTPSSAPAGTLALPDTSLTTSRVDSLPSTFCFFIGVGGRKDDTPGQDSDREGHRKGRRKLAACIVTPERQAVSATASGYTGETPGRHASQALSINQWWTRFYVGPSYSVHVSDAVALGASVQAVGTIANSTWSVDTLVTDTAGMGSSSAYDTGANAYSLDVTALLGVIWHIDRTQTLGLSLMTPSAHVLGQYQGTTNIQTQAATSMTQQALSSGSYRAPVPLRLGAGFGADLPRAHVEADATTFLPVTDLARAEVQTTQTDLVGSTATSSSLARTLTVAGQPIVDAALGLEWFTSSGLSLLGGVSTDFSAMKPLAQSPPIGTLAETRTQRATLSLGIGSYGSGSELLFGTQLSCAWGKSIAVDPYESPPSLTLVDSRTYGAMLIIAGSVSLTAFKRTLQDLQTVVKLPVVK